MLEIPEAAVIASQISQRLSGREVLSAEVGVWPHKFAWLSAEPESYIAALKGACLQSSVPAGGMVEVSFGPSKIVFCDGVRLRFTEGKDDAPEKHQLLIRLSDGSILTASVQMYGGIYLSGEGRPANKYHERAIACPSPLSDAFDMAYFLPLFEGCKGSLSVKAFLATEQRVPGLGNGVLHDILFEAELNHKTKISDLDANREKRLFSAITGVLKTMRQAGGRDTEQDLYGRPGSFATIAGRHAAGKPCRRCGGEIAKESYLGGSIYYCRRCQCL